ncbi:MAG TPA: PQQ-dependent sugar dehydrogenase [Actinomycetes bacterium]|jgi:glucose/arabinose dehydrogenase|nr:PQQ-dependent sugar dehydrogenase [Actinomycetes bacterium]
MRIKPSPVALVLLLALGAAACSSGGDSSSGAPAAPTATPTSAPSSSERSPSQPSRSGDLSKARVRLDLVARLSSPVGMAVRKGDPALYVIEQSGRLRALRDGKLDPTPVLDVSSLVASGGERGLLGIAFSPDGRYLYLDYTDVDGNTHVAEFAMRGARPDQASRRNLLTVQQPFSNHNGGQLAFGPDGHLYIALGDGGSAGDPSGNGQSLDALLGKILRISPRPSGGRPYGIPPDNPFVGRSGARPEIWDYGLRNPWRFSFDPATGDLWIADVGQGAWEEIDREPAGRGGRNYGWNRLEGSHRYQGDAPSGAVAPVIEYSHQGGACTVIGGSVYRGKAIPDLVGAYLYGDYCAGWIRAAPVSDGRVGDSRDLGINVRSLTSFGVDQRGELYALSQAGGVYRIVPA